MSKVDWAKAPDGAEFYGQGMFWRIVNKMHCYYSEQSDAWLLPEHWHHPTKRNDYERKPDHIVDTNEKVWPESDDRVNIIGQNGNDGLVYQRDSKMHYDEFREQDMCNKFGCVTADDLKNNLKPTYNREVIGLDGTKTTIDVYRVLDAFKTESAALDHAVKKILCAGNRHSKDRKQDLQEAIDSIAAELLIMSQR